MTVLLPTATGAKGPRCCGIQDAKWSEIVGDALEEELQRAAELLGDLSPRATYARAEGPSVAAAIGAYAAREACDLIALPKARIGPGGDFPRGIERELQAEEAVGRVVRMPGT